MDSLKKKSLLKVFLADLMDKECFLAPLYILHIII